MKIKVMTEIPQYSKFKFEVNDGWLTLDRVLNQEIPYTYGYIPGTLCGDGDALDIFIIANGNIPPLTELEVEIIGGFKCLDNNEEDNKLIGQLVGDNTYPRTAMIKHYLETYKPEFKVLEEVNKEEAIKIYENSMVK